MTIQGGRIVELNEEGLHIYDCAAARDRGEIMATLLFAADLTNLTDLTDLTNPTDLTDLTETSI